MCAPTRATKRKPRVKRIRERSSGIFMEFVKAENIRGNAWIGKCGLTGGGLRMNRIQIRNPHSEIMRNQAVIAWPPAFSSLSLAEPLNFWR